MQAAIKAGVTVCLATGKARPAALSALTPVGLAGALLELVLLYKAYPEVASIDYKSC